MSNSEILGLHRITKKHLKDLCKKHKLYQTPDLNDQLYLHFQGFQSIENLEEYTGLKCLWLESNAISEIQGLDCQTKLKCLFLQNNLIKKIENLQSCTLLDTLNLSSNHITKIENCGIDILPALSTLNLSRNYLQNSDAIRELLNCKQLWSLDLSHNRLDDILVVKVFAQMPELRVLVLQGNPVVSKVPQYRKTLILECKNLTYLDSRPVFPKDRACAEAWKRGGYEEERKEHDRWMRMDRKKTRDSVNATLRLRQKHGAGDIQLLESSDDENEKKLQDKLKQIPYDGTSSGDLEIIGGIEKASNSLSNSPNSSSSSSSSSSSDDYLFQPKYEKKNKNDKEITQELRKNNITNEFEEQLMIEEVLNKGVSFPNNIVEELKEAALVKEKCSQETCKDIRKGANETIFEKSEYESTESRDEIETKSDGNCILEMEEDQELLQKTNIDSSSTLDFAEQNQSANSLCYSSFSESSFTNNLSSVSKNNSSELELEQEIICRNEEQEVLQESIETNNESDVLTLSTSEFSEQNKSTESLSFSSSSGSSFSGNDSSELKNAVVPRSEDQEILQAPTETNKEKESTESKDEISTKFDENCVLGMEKDQELLQKTNKYNSSTPDCAEQNQSTNSLCYLSFSEPSFTKNSSSASKNNSSELELEKQVICRNEEQEVLQESIETNNESEFLTLSTSEFSEQNESTTSLSFSTSSESSLSGNDSSELENAVVPRSKDQEILQDPTETNKEKESGFLSLSTSDCSEQNELTKSLSASYLVPSPLIKKSSTDVSNKKDENESLKISNDEKQNVFLNQNNNSSSESPTILTEQKMLQTNLCEPLDDTEARIKNIFKMILTDGDSDSSLDLPAETLDDQTKTQKLSYSKRSLEDDSTEIFVVNDEKAVFSKNRDLRLEDTIASSWLENFLVEEGKKENSPPRRLIEEIDNNDSCIAIYDSTENIVASDWLEQDFYGEELKYPLEAVKDQIMEEATEISELSNFLEEEFEEIPSNLENDLYEKLPRNKIQKKESSALLKEDRSSAELAYEYKENQEKLKNPQIFVQLKGTGKKPKKENFTKVELREHVETDLLAGANEEKSLTVLVSKEDDHTALYGKNKQNFKSSAEGDLLGNNNQFLSWWESKLAAARIEISKTAQKANEDGETDSNEESEQLKSDEDKEVFQQIDKDVSEIPLLEDQGDASNFLERIMEKIIDTEVEVQLIQNPVLSAEHESSQKYTEQYAEGASESRIAEKQFGDSSSSSFESSLGDTSPVSTLREVVTTFDEVVESISSLNRQKSQLLKELIANPLTKTFSGQTGEQINRQFNELKQQKQEQLSNYVDYVYAQREKYADTLDVVNGRLMVIKRSTSALEELPPPLLSQRTGSTKYISCGVSTTPTSCNDDDGDSDSDDFETALSEDNDDEEENDIEQHASDTKIKNIPTSLSDVNYCANESVSLSSSGSSTEIEKEENDNNHHHSDVVDDSQQGVAGRFHNEIDSEVLPESCKSLGKKDASASVPIPADYKLSRKRGGAQTRSDLKVELEDSFQSFLDFGENASALDNIALIFENPDESGE